MAGYTDIPPSYFDTLIARPGEMLADTAVGVIEGGRKLRDMYNTTEDYLDEGLARVGDLFDRSPPRMTGGPMSRNGYRHHSGVPKVAEEVVPLMGANPHFFESQNNPHGAWSPDYIAEEKERYQDWIEATNSYQDQKEHMRRIDTGLGTLYPGEATDRYYKTLANDIIDKNNASRDRHREGMASGAYKAWSNQTGRGLIDGRMIGEDMNTHGRIHPVLKANWEDEMHDLGRSQDARHPYQWKESDNRSDWQKWKDSTKSGRR